MPGRSIVLTVPGPVRAGPGRYDLPVPLGLGMWEIVILVGILVLLFGAKGLPQVARRLGTGMREVKDAVAEVDPRRMLDPPAAPPPQRGRAPSRVVQSPPSPPAEPMQSGRVDADEQR